MTSAALGGYRRLRSAWVWGSLRWRDLVVMHFARERENARALSVHGDFSLNVTHSLAAQHLLGLGLESVTASHDLNPAQLLDLLANVAGRF